MIEHGSYVRCHHFDYMLEDVIRYGQVVGPELFRYQEPARLVVWEDGRERTQVPLRYLQPITKKEYFHYKLREK